MEKQVYNLIDYVIRSIEEKSFQTVAAELDDLFPRVVKASSLTPLAIVAGLYDYVIYDDFDFLDQMANDRKIGAGTRMWIDRNG